MILSGTAPEPLAFTIDDPARIALDLPETALGLSSRRKDVNLGPLDTVLTAEANGRTRVVLNLDSMVPYEMRRSGNTIVRGFRRAVCCPALLCKYRQPLDHSR